MTADRAYEQETAGFDNQSMVRSLTSVLAEIAQPRSRIEEAFSSIGGNLVGASSRLCAISETLSAISRDLEARSGEDFVRGLSSVKARAHALVTRPEERVLEIPAITRKARALEGPITSLRDTIRAISLVAVPLRIESTDFNDSHNSFDVFTSEVTRLSSDAGKALKEFSNTYEALITRLETAKTSSDALAIKAAASAGEVSARIDAGLEKVRVGAECMGGARMAIDQRFREIEALLGTTVSAIQFGDIARQRIEHIEEGISLALKTLDGSVDARSGLAFAQRAGFLSAICRLQAEQTHDTMSAFDEGAGALVGLLSRLAENAQSIVNEGERMRGAVLETSRTLDDEVAADLRAVLSLVDETDRHRRALGEALGSVAETMGKLFGQLEPLRQMRTGVHLLSINMALRSSQLGPKGRSIRVIAHELSELSSQTVTQVSTVISMLQEASSQAVRLATNSEDARRFDEEVLAVKSAIEAARRGEAALDLDQSFAALRTDGIEVSRLVQTAALKAQIQSEISRALRSAHHSLKSSREGLLGSVPSADRSDLEAHESAALEDLRRTYTMVSERDVHDRALGVGGGAAAASAAGGLDDIFL